MENKMKQFNLQEYLSHPERKVVTRDGRPVRIICTDSDAPGGPIVAIVTMPYKRKLVLQFYENGRYLYSNIESNDDLCFAPNKHTDYINLYYTESGYSLGSIVFSTEEEAKENADGDEEYITTIKAEWEE